MLNLEMHPYFEKFTDAESGVESYILTKKPTRVVQSFYFVNQSFSDNGKYLWMYCACPPLPYRSLAVVGMDENKPFIKHFPHAIWDHAAPLVAEGGESVYFALRGVVYQMFLDGTVEVFAKVPEDYVKNRLVFWAGTHLTISADKKYTVLDGNVGNEYFVSTIDMKTREVKIIHDFAHCHNHAQFSPVDPDLFLYDEDWCIDPISGRHHNFNSRAWFMNIQGTRYEPVSPDKWFGKNSQICHDFWAGDGSACWIDYEKGAFEMNMKTGNTTHVWKRPLCHAHCNYDRSLWCADQSPYYWTDVPCETLFYHRDTNTEIKIFSKMPAPEYPRSSWHIDPHPQFTLDGEYIVSTITVRNGTVDLAITPVYRILEKYGLQR